MNKKDLELEKLIETLRLSCEVEGLSAKATEWYTAFPSRFGQFLDRRQMPAD